MSLLFKRYSKPDANGKRKELSPYWYVTKTRESTKTVNRKHAEEYARKALTEHWRSEALGEVTHTWSELCDDWLDFKEGQSSYDQDRMVIERFSELLTRREIASLADIDGETIAAYGKAVKAECSAATANRHFTTLRAMLNRAKNKEWIQAVPRIENYTVPKKEPRWLTLAQFETILPHLPEWVADMAIVAVQTGLRYSNVAGMRWDWLSADGSVVIVPAVHTKTARTYTVPLSSKSKEIFKKLASQQSSSPFVFGEPRRVRYWWETATDKAGFSGFRWHDLRHTWASLMTQNGVPDRVLKELGGWASTRMLDTYAHLSTSHLVEYVERVNK